MSSDVSRWRRRMMVVGWCTFRRICHIVAGDDAAAADAAGAADAADDDGDDGSLVMELV
eukprot:CAMPEP_0171840980 /NCGR_PEP_ID=MMETSP0992-20121227/14295_1 /TAXON_ID=483369 /ORGANISM="non described non described, Strain CCMP2098" /LENGTH=58 /DNA_ID=CAMNT_0012457885 /DNA_START=315 /DNA_END=491 /DNA_ORIENTATION=+